MKTKLLTAMFVFGAIANEAQAQCDSPYTADSLASDLGAMSEALRSSNRAAFQTRGSVMTDGLPCVDAPLAPMVLANVYRYAGLSAYFGGESARAEAWFRVALELDSSFDWDVKEIPVDDPIRSVFEAQRENAGVDKIDAAGGRALLESSSHRLLVDGRVLGEPKLTPDRPHLVQQVAVSTNAVEAVWLVEGAQLPDSVLGGVQATAGAATDTSKFEVQKIERTRPPMKTPTIILGGLGVAGGVGMYVMSFQAKKQFEAASTTAQLEKKRALTNGLVLGATGAVALGSGLTYLGVMLDGGTGIRLGGAF